MKIYITGIVLTVIAFFFSSCLKVANAKCFYNENGLLSVRENGSVIAFILVGKKGNSFIKSSILLNGKIIDEEHVKKSLEIFNSFEADNKTCSWAGISLETWGSETIQYNCEGGISLWFTKGTLSGIQIIPGLLMKSRSDIQINGKSVKLMDGSDYKKFLGIPLKEKSYWSEY